MNQSWDHFSCFPLSNTVIRLCPNHVTTIPTQMKHDHHLHETSPCDWFQWQQDSHRFTSSTTCRKTHGGQRSSLQETSHWKPFTYPHCKWSCSMNANAPQQPRTGSLSRYQTSPTHQSQVSVAHGWQTKNHLAEGLWVTHRQCHC